VRPPARIGPALALALAIAGCGGGTTITKTSTGPGNVTEKPSSPVNGERTFSAPGMAIHFKYPARFVAVSLAPSRRIAGRTARATHSAIAIGIYDLLIVSRYPGLKIPVTAANVAQLKPQFDAVISKVLERKVTGTVGSAGGLPAIYWPREPVSGLPVKATVMVVNVFVGSDEYELQCQATPAELSQIEGACKEMLDTLTTHSPS
jgi:hypothetical protein